MRADGHWLACDDGIIRPAVQGLVRAADGHWAEVTFLLDAGADRTVFSASFIHLLQPSGSVGTERFDLAGVGGRVCAIDIETVIAFRKDDGRITTVRGPFAIFTEIESADMSVLGRDVTNNFGVIYDYSSRLVVLLAPPHFYEIKLR
jgi:hypothetical protein